ncbi:MAG: hypothetical protein QXT73_02960 [Candidatus Methanomethylicaceae archaeon]
MRKVYERLFVGNELDCRNGGDNWAVVHACKSPCHQRAVGYRGNLSSHHPHYLVLERGNDLFLNMIDPPTPLFMPTLFTEFLKFTKTHWNSGKNVLIHCNHGESRAPSLALLFLAKIVGMLPNDSYESAWKEYRKLDAGYQPGLGIQIHLATNWDQL